MRQRYGCTLYLRRFLVVEVHEDNGILLLCHAAHFLLLEICKLVLKIGASYLNNVDRSI